MDVLISIPSPHGDLRIPTAKSLLIHYQQKYSHVRKLKKSESFKLAIQHSHCFEKLPLNGFIKINKCMHTYFKSIDQFIAFIHWQWTAHKQEALWSGPICGSCINQLLLSINIDKFMLFCYRDLSNFIHFQLKLNLDYNKRWSGYELCCHLFSCSRVFKLFTSSSNGTKLFWSVWDFTMFQFCEYSAKHIDFEIINTITREHWITKRTQIDKSRFLAKDHQQCMWNSYFLTNVLLFSVKHWSLKEMHYFMVNHMPTFFTFIAPLTAF
eukprot:212194_1